MVEHLGIVQLCMKTLDSRTLNTFSCGNENREYSLSTFMENRHVTLQNKDEF